MATKKDQKQKKGKSKKPTPSAKNVTAASRKRPSERTAKSAENDQTSPSFVADDQVLENPRVMPMPEGNRESGALQERATSPELEQLLAHTKALGDINTNATKFFDNANTKLGRLEKLEGMAKSLSDHTSTLNSVDTRLGKLDKLESMSTSLSDHTSKLSSVDTKLGKLDKLDSVTTSLNEHTSKLGSVDTKLNKLDKLEGMATSLSEQTSKLSNVNARLSKLDKLEEMTTSLNDHTSKLANLDRLASVDIKLDKLNEPPLTSLGLNDQGEEVSKLQKNLLQLGFEIPAEEEADNARTFGIGTLNALLEFQAEHKLPASGVLDSNTKSVLGRVIANGKKPPSIKGRIVSEQGIPLSGVKVRFYSRGFGANNSTKLGESNADTKGYFTVPEVKMGPNLEVYVVKVEANGKETEIKLARTRFNPATHEVLNLVAPSDLMMRESEYQRLSDGLKSHLPSNRTNHMMALTDAREQAENQTQSTRQDLTVLSRATGWDARLIALAALAARLTNEVGLTQEVLYGLLRAGLPSDKLLLAQVSKEVAEQALKKMRDAEIIKFTDDEIGQFKQQFATFANGVRLNVCAPGSRSTYDELLKGSGLLKDTQATFADIYLNHRGDADELWRKAAESKTITPEVIQTLKRQGKLAFLAGNSEEMVTRLMNKFTEQKIADPVQLVEKGFYHPDAWSSEVFDQAGIPQNRRNNLTEDDKIELDKRIPTAYFGENLEDRLDAYAKDMARKIKRSYPTHVIGHMIQQDHENEFKLGASRVATAQLVKSAAAQGFRLGQTPVESFLQAHTGVRESMSDVAEEDFQMAKQQLKTLHRVYQLTPSTEAMTVLLGQGLTSAYDILSLSKDTFLKIHGSSFSSLDQAQLVYQKAQQVSSVTYNLFSIVKKLDSELPIFGMSASPEVRKSVRDELIKRFPTMESLFGSMDYCECEHCRSVLSPAAYLVDLLQFLDPDEPAWNGFREDWKKGHNEGNYPFGKPYEVLIERRPDLPNIQLTCENTNTAMPYIDIVNEILEYYVAKGKLEESAAHDTGDATSAELLAEPQNVIREAYDKLREARYPLNLPFDLWIETVRQFCNYFEMPLDRVLTAFRPSDKLFASAQTFDRFGIFMESLELSPAELDIFTDPDPLNNWHKLYGYETADKAKTVVTDPITGQRVDLNSAKTLSRRLGVTYKDIVEIIQTEFVNPELTKLTLLNKLGVTIQDAWFYLNANHRYLYEQNKDLIGKSREDLSPEDQKRFDNLSRKFGKYKTCWEIVHEIAAFEQRLKHLTEAFVMQESDLQKTVKAIPFDKILVLADPDAGCNFDLTTLQYANSTPADDIAFLRINLFVRLWRKLGWSIGETDRALNTFIPQSAPFNKKNLVQQPLKTALICLAHLKALDEKVQVGKQSRLKLLTLWSDIPTTGKNSLYAQLFLTRSVLKSGEVEFFADAQTRRLSVFDHPLGQYLEPYYLATIAEQVRHEVRLLEVKEANKIKVEVFAGEERISLRYDALGETQYLAYRGLLSDSEKNRLAALSPSDTLSKLLDAAQVKAREFTLIKGHVLALQGTLGLTADEIGRILKDAGKALDTAELSLPNVSVLYRYGLLAKALKLSVRELITLKQLSGLDPFKPLHSEPLTTIEQDHPFSQTLRFVEIVEQVRDGGLKTEDLDYLLRHCFDETGPYRPNREKMMGLLKTLSEGIRAIRAEHIVPVSPDALGEETLRQKLGLALTPDVVERFLAMINGTAEFTATVVGEKLAAETFTDEPAIRQVIYNDISKEQKLTFRGVLVEDIKEELKKEFAAALVEPQQKAFASLLDNIQNLARDFFDNQLKKQPLRLNDEAGFLEDSDYEELFRALTPLKKVLPTDTAEEITNKVQQNEDIERENQKTMQQRRYRTAQAFLPWLQQRLIRQFIVQAMIAQTSADPALVESLVTDERLLAKPDANPLLVSLAMTGEQGINATFFDSDDLLGENQPTPPILRSADTALKDATGTNGTPLKSANSARFEGYFEVPAPGAYRFYVMLEKQDAEAELRLDHLPDPVFLKGKADVDNKTLDEYLELKTGILYRFSLELKKLNGGRGRLLVQSETLPKDGIDQLKLHPLSAMAGAQSAIILLTKALQLVQSLGLSEREISYVLTHAKDFGDISLSRLPIQAVKDTSEEKEKTTQQFAQILRLVSYGRLKNDLAAGTNDLIELFEANGTDDLSKVYPLIAKLTRRDEATVKATANALVSAAPTFASEEPLVRLWEALQIVERFGVSAASLQEWTDIISVAATPEQRFEIAHELKDTIKARFEPETWQRVAQPIFDKLRQRQRDALVAHVMHQHSFDRIEQLYEYFLIDPGMEPVVQTSRIRLAISTVQLFIQRCLLNLERNVHTSAINSKQWEWMKRYRVWEANRKIFLFPENWLEPEFRDDKTHLFTELEGALLQGDVSNDLVEDAFLNYLKKLDELARLDIIAMHCEDKPDPAQNTLHVFGRTFSQPHKYFYRRYAHQAWTPWEPVTAEIEGDHLAPVVWRDRLYLFWVTFMDKPNENGKPDPLDDKPSEASLSQLMTAMQAVSKDKQIDVQLHWSEYLHGEWSTRVSGGFVPATSSVAMLVKKGNTISTLINTEWSTIPITVPLTFDTRQIFIHVAVQATNKDAEEGGVYIHLKGTDGFQHSFYLAGRNCLPEKTGYKNKPRSPYNISNTLTTVYKGNSPFKVEFNKRILSATSAIEQTKTILNSSREFTLLPCNNDIRLGKIDSTSVAADNPAAVAEAINSGLAEIASLMKPVFYQDKTNTLFVEPNVTERTIEEWNDWIPPVIKPETHWGNPDWWKELPVTPDIPKGARPYPGTPDTWPQVDSDSYIKTNPGTDWLVNSITGLVFDGEVVGPQGHAGLEIVPSFEGLGAIIEGGIPIEAQAGSHLAAGDVLVIRDDTTFGQSGLTQQAGGLNVVGNAGLNSTLAQNVRLGTNSPAHRNGR